MCHAAGDAGGKGVSTLPLNVYCYTLINLLFEVCIIMRACRVKPYTHSTEHVCQNISSQGTIVIWIIMQGISPGGAHRLHVWTGEGAAGRRPHPTQSAKIL